MESFKIVIVLGVVFLGALSIFTGIGAEVTLAKLSYCVDTDNPAKALSLTAAGALLVGHIIINAASGCLCCRRSKGNSNTAKLRWFSVLSWVAFLIGMRLFLAGAAVKDGIVNERAEYGYESCYYVKTGVFGSGSFLSAFSLGLAVFCYVAYTAADTAAAAVHFDPPMPHYYNPQFPPNYNAKPPHSHFGLQQV